MTTSWVSASRSHPGKVRATNEDSVFIHPDGMLWAVADGMGGYEGGDKASAIIAEELGTIQYSTEINALITQTRQQLSTANTRIRQYSQQACDGRSVGSTIVSLLATSHELACIWAGDSRLYRIRSETLTQISRDHSEVAHLIELGYLTEAEAETHPNRNVITQSIGLGQEQEAEVISVEYLKGDRFLLCSDGLYNELDRHSILTCFQSDEIDIVAESLMSRCLQTPARDNISYIVLQTS